ncbi:MAG: methyltransferase domain-containing protein [Actinomycetia bacterium]|nr:methyltransferase domain-containing protein [Actinomycetes bacterium]
MTEEAGSLETYHKDHWVDIEPDRLDRYDQLFKLDDPQGDAVLGRVGVQAGQTIVDFGCGPGYVAAQLARLTGPNGHVHAVDVNEDFVAMTRRVAAGSGRGDRITVHHSQDELIPLADDSADLAYAKNVLEYVPDVGAVLGELHRTLRPGGTMVASDSDFGFVVIEPLTPAEIAELFDAAAPAFKQPNIGRKLKAAFGTAGFSGIEVEVTAAVDHQGRFRTVVQNMLGYGMKFGRMSESRAAELTARVDTGLADGTYLAVLPQWWVTGTK